MINALVNKLKADKHLSILILLFIVLTPIFLTPVIYGYDGPGYYVYARSLIIDVDLDFENEYEHYKEIYPYIEVMHSEVTGNTINQYTIGTSLFWSPFFLAAHGISYLFGLPLDGYSSVYVGFVTFGSALLAFIGLILIYKLSSEFVSKRLAFLGTLTFWLASPLFFYMFLLPSMSHAVSFFSAALMIFFWYFKIRPMPLKRICWGRWFVFGLVVALSVLVRFQNIFYVIIPLMFFIHDFLRLNTREKLKSLINPLIGIVAFVLLFIPQFFVWNYLLGGFNYVGTRTANSSLVLDFGRIFDILVLGRNGLFVWTPVLLFGFIGLILLFRKHKLLVSSFLVTFLLHLILISGQLHWWGGSSFGNRFFVSTAVFFIPGFCYFLAKLRKRWLIYLVCLVLILWNFNLMLQYGSRMLGDEVSVTIFDVFKNTFTKAIPLVKSIAKNFLFNRGKFL